MPDNEQRTLFAVDCGATNWRLYRLEYQVRDASARLLGEPQPAPLTSFIDRRLPAVVCLDPSGSALESYGEVAQQQLEDERNRDRVREYFKPCIGSHLESSPLPHQKRYTHTQALQYTQMLLAGVLEQLRQEKWRGEPFDEQIWFTFAYPVHWRYGHEGKTFIDFQRVVQACFDEGFQQIRFVAEPEGAILGLQRRGLLEQRGADRVTLIVDGGGSTTDIIAGQVEAQTGRLEYIGHYGEPFGGGLYDAELAKHIADELGIPASALADDPSALISLRVSAQRLKESLSRQLQHGSTSGHVPQRTITLVMQGGAIYRRVVAMDEVRFREITRPLAETFQSLIDQALAVIAVQEQDIGQVVLVGGGAQLFTICEYLRARFGRQKVILADNPEEIVVQGIGLEYAASMAKIEPTIHIPAVEPRTAAPVEAGSVRTESGWRLVRVDGEEIPIYKGVTKIGRGEGNELQIDDLKASRVQAELRTDGEELEVVDLGSTNGTFVNARQLPANQPHALAVGDEIFFGKTRFICARKPPGPGEKYG